MVTGDGNFPFSSSWLRRRRRSGTDMLYKSFVSENDTASSVFNDFFFEAGLTPTTPIMVKTGGVFTTLTGVQVKVSGVFQSVTPKAKIGGVFA